MATNYANYVYDTHPYDGKKLHIIKTPASNIRLINLVGKKSLPASGYYGINGCFFSNHMLNIVMNAGGPIGPRMTISVEGVARNIVDGEGIEWNGEGIVGWNGTSMFAQHGVHYAKDVVGAANESSWAQGGYSMFIGDARWESKLKAECAGYNLPDHYKSSTERTVLVANLQLQQVYLIVSAVKSYFTWESMRAAVQDYLAITDSTTNFYENTIKGLFLDGGGSSQMYCKGENGSIITINKENRPLHEIIALKKTT